jgi:hypothetical protein
MVLQLNNSTTITSNNNYSILQLLTNKSAGWQNTDME